MHHVVNKTKGIITLYRHQRAAFAITSKRGPTPKTPKTPTTELPPGSTITTDTDEVGDRGRERLPAHLPVTVFFNYLFLLFQNKKNCLVQRRGAEFSLMTVARHFGQELTRSLPYLWEFVVGPLRAVVENNQGIGMLHSSLDHMAHVH